MSDAVSPHRRVRLLTTAPTSETADVGRWVRQAQQGSREAFGTLYERFGGYVYAILVVRLPPTEARDLVQDVFLQAWQRLHTLADPAAFAGWLATIARHRAIDVLRRTSNTDPLPDRLEDPRAATAASLNARVDAARALAALRQLPEAYRETLALRLIQGLTGPEIARISGLTPESVRVNLHRGFKLLRTALEQRTP